MNQHKITIAIDGYSSTGKSTFAKAIAQRLGYIYVDSGAMYRAVTLYSLQNGLIDANGVINTAELIRQLTNINVGFTCNNQAGRSETMLNGKNVETEIRGIEVSNHVSPLSAIPEVREQMVALQRVMGQNGGVVMDGRDIGSVVFPNAELKIFMTADPKVRAMRRYKELQEKGESVSMQEVEENISQRDYNDTHRATSPLVQVKDAIVLDNSNMTPDEQLVWFDGLFKEALGKLSQ